MNLEIYQLLTTKY